MCDKAQMAWVGFEPQTQVTRHVRKSFREISRDIPFGIGNAHDQMEAQ